MGPTCRGIPQGALQRCMQHGSERRAHQFLSKHSPENALLYPRKTTLRHWPVPNLRAIFRANSPRSSFFARLSWTLVLRPSTHSLTDISEHLREDTTELDERRHRVRGRAGGGLNASA